jgi:hypothetical protein
MAIKRLHPGFGIGEDSCISGNHPMREDDVLRGTEGLYLGANPESPSKGLFITYWEADEIAQKIGFPHIAVYQAQKDLIDQQALEIAELERRLDSEIHNLQLKAVSTEIKNVKKELLREVEGLTAAIRARLGNSGSNVDALKGAAKPAGGSSAL